MAGEQNPIGEPYRALACELDEHRRRLWAAAQASSVVVSGVVLINSKTIGDAGGELLEVRMAPKGVRTVAPRMACRRVQRPGWSVDSAKFH